MKYCTLKEVQIWMHCYYLTSQKHLPHSPVYSVSPLKMGDFIILICYMEDEKLFQPSIPRNYMHIGWFPTSRFMSIVNAKCQCRKYSVFRFGSLNWGGGAQWYIWHLTRPKVFCCLTQTVICHNHDLSLIPKLNPYGSNFLCNQILL